MKLGKRFVIWAALMIAVTLLVNTAGLVLGKIMLKELAPAMRGYVKKTDDILHPTPKEPDEKSRNNGLTGFVLRAILDNNRIDNTTDPDGILIFNVDQSVMFLEKEGVSPLEKGSFEVVYADTGEMSYLRNIIGLISVNEFCRNDCAEELYTLLKNTPDAVIQVNSYSISDYVVSPASLTVYDGGGSIAGTFSCDASGEIITADNIYIRNSNTGTDDTADRCCSFYEDMGTVLLGERRTDRRAEKLAEKLTFDGESEYQHGQFGFGHYAYDMYEVSDNNAMVTTLDLNYLPSELIVIGIAAIPITLLTFLVGRKKKNDSETIVTVPEIQ